MGRRPAEVRTLPLGVTQTNCYVVTDPESGYTAVIDPGLEPERVVAAVRGLDVRLILCTHGHFDHVYSVRDVKEATGAPLYIGEGEREWLTDPRLNRSGLWPDICPRPITGPPPDRVVADGDRIPFGAGAFEVIFTPGHTPGHVAYRLGNAVFAGDTLFRMGMGRVDLPGGDYTTLVETIRAKLYTLPDGTVILPGHGPPTTVGEEKRHNPFVTP